MKATNLLEFLIRFFNDIIDEGGYNVEIFQHIFVRDSFAFVLYMTVIG